MIVVFLLFASFITTSDVPTVHALRMEVKPPQARVEIENKSSEHVRVFEAEVCYAATKQRDCETAYITGDFPPGKTAWSNWLYLRKNHVLESVRIVRIQSIQDEL